MLALKNMKIKLLENISLDGKSYKADDVVETADNNANQLIKIGKALPSESQNKSIGLKTSKPKKKLEVKDEEIEPSSSDNYLD